MSIKDLLEKYPHIKPYLLPFGIGVIGLLLIGVGIASVFTQPSKEDMSFETKQSSEVSNLGKLQVKEIVVDVAGAVVKPGIYHLLADSRLQDGLIAAGGLSKNADREFVEKHINLAVKLADGGKLYIPKLGERNSPDNTSQNDQFSSSDSSLLDVNQATSAQLDGLPGIGAVTAEKIIKARPYNDLQDLLTKKIISTKVFNEIKDKISLY
jgi:competence protein ComEA